MRLSRLLLLTVAVSAFSLEATNGYFSAGYGTPYKSMAGAGTALGLSTLAPATNPAANAFVGKGYDIGIAYFNPNREFTVTGNPSGYPGTFGLAPGTVESHSTGFVLPSLGANWQLNDKMTLGVMFYGNGGMNTDYHARVFGFDPTGVNLEQMFLAPTFTYKVHPNHAFGLTVVGAFQRFQAEGLQAFAPFSQSPANLTNNGYATSFGWSVRLGYMGQISKVLSVGLSYQTEIAMSKLDEYSGLFAEGGYFDVPPTWSAGIALKPVEALTIALDVQWIGYSTIPSIANPMLPNLMMAPLGSNGGAGFGWEDMTIYKLGLQFEAGSGWTLRAGYSYGEQPIPESEVLFNILAPAVIEQHITLGVSKTLGKGKALHLSLMHALENTVTGPNPLEAPGQQKIELKMNEYEAEIGFSFGF
ncbi:MAG: outer membrane protein transport protein [Acidobacteria bacterium]|nr:outer membrane protein transport protein [Acidobacteriota bacterium]MCG3194036.1 hypothetical protein [Thermoanaerobaculia bacterium]